MEEVSVQIDTISLDKTATVVVDIESLAQPSDRSSGSPKVKRALSRKWSYRAERLTITEEEDIDESSKKTLVKANLNSSNVLDSTDGRNRRFNRLMAVNPRKILCIFATMSSVGTLILIYFTLAINRAF